MSMSTEETETASRVSQPRKTQISNQRYEKFVIQYSFYIIQSDTLDDDDNDDHYFKLVQLGNWNQIKSDMTEEFICQSNQIWMSNLIKSSKMII